MKLRKIDYTENDGRSDEWRLIDCTFDDINLIVGRNAIGKTRTLHVILGLANLISISQKLKFISG